MPSNAPKMLCLFSVSVLLLIALSDFGSKNRAYGKTEQMRAKEFFEMEQEKSALTQWLERRQKSKTEPDDDFLTMLAELFRGQ